MTSGTIALILLTQTVASPVLPVPAPALSMPPPLRLSATAAGQATATIIEAREITFAQAPPPRWSHATNQLRRLIEFE